MVNHKIYCISIYDETFDNIKNINCIPVGLGNNISHEEWLRDNTLENISQKNKNYGELTFYYWFWKNELKKITENQWIGFSQYRRHWKNKNPISSSNKPIDLFLKDTPKDWDNYETILGDPLDLSKIKFMKLFKHAKKIILNEPKFLLQKNRNLRFNFGMMHGMDFLEKAISQLNEEDKNDFSQYLNSQTMLNPANMFICRSRKKMDELFKILFNWLAKCAVKFNSYDLKGYSQKRIYAFLSERFLPYWLKKNTRVLEWPIYYYDLRKGIQA